MANVVGLEGGFLPPAEGLQGIDELRIEMGARNMGKRILKLILPMGLLVASIASGQEIFGWIEPVGLPGAGVEMMAKLDTGADTSSLDATNIRRVKRGGRSLVKFELRHPETGETFSVERPYVRSTRIRRHSGKYQTRHVVHMKICLGNSLETVEINLIDRSNFNYPMLLGRNALAGIALVDSSITETSHPRCDTAEDEAP
jgi:hypothetical protein